MPENRTPGRSGMRPGDFIPLEQAWDLFRVEENGQRIADICDACQRIRTKWVEPDGVCTSHPGNDYSDCLARFYSNARKRLD